ncbi:hypothetical protein C8F01DRAFT_1237169 [Mycena amicta]|nr:hypothetical protein C8F01DRAFT_1237169 [Mycena amicta]
MISIDCSLRCILVAATQSASGMRLHSATGSVRLRGPQHPRTIHHTTVLHRKLAIPDAINHGGQTNTKELEVMDWWRRRADASPDFANDTLPEEHIAIRAGNREDSPRLRYSCVFLPPPLAAHRTLGLPAPQALVEGLVVSEKRKLPRWMERIRKTPKGSTARRLVVGHKIQLIQETLGFTSTRMRASKKGGLSKVLEMHTGK